MTILVISIVGILIVNLVLAHIIAKTSLKKEVGYNTVFWVSFLFTPIIGLLLSIASPLDEGKVHSMWHGDSIGMVCVYVTILSAILSVLYLLS